jgi:hypothetical protein
VSSVHYFELGEKGLVLRPQNGSGKPVLLLPGRSLVVGLCGTAVILLGYFVSLIEYLVSESNRVTFDVEVGGYIRMLQPWQDNFSSEDGRSKQVKAEGESRS